MSGHDKQIHQKKISTKKLKRGKKAEDNSVCFTKTARRILVNAHALPTVGYDLYMAKLAILLVMLHIPL